MPLTIGYYVHNNDNVKLSLRNSIDNSFQFILTPLSHPKCSEFIPFSDVFLGGSDRSKVTIFIPKRNYLFRKNTLLLDKEITYASHIGISNIVIDCPNNFQSIENMAIVINRKLEFSETHNLAISIKIPIISHKVQSNELRSNPEEIDDDLSWLQWNHFRKIIQSHPSISIALEINGELPDSERLYRWLGEPITFVILPTSIFLTNNSKFPVLNKSLQSFLGEVNFKMARNFAFIIKGNNLHGHIKHYVQYIEHLKNTELFVDQLEPYCRDYEDLLQIPLQPLKDNLDSSVYEVFETDTIKYRQYEKAISRALDDSKDECINVMVVGAGRGPLVDKALKAASRSYKYIKVFAVEKNPNAIITLNLLRDLKWGGKKGLPHGVVEIVSCDMRLWNPKEKADIVISELLGSFGDNELSPECLDGVWRYCHEYTISIPCSYTSYLCPVQSHRLYSQLLLEKRNINVNPYEYAYVTHVRNAYLIDNPKPVFTFEHLHLSQPPSSEAAAAVGVSTSSPSSSTSATTNAPNATSNLSSSNDDTNNSSIPIKGDNNRSKYLTFKSKIKTICHGFVGYFECCLIDDIKLSIVPTTQNSNMYSWFPIYFPVQQPFDLDPEQSLEVHWTRNVNEQHVWYEWTIFKPIQSKIHNLNGKHYSISLY